MTGIEHQFISGGAHRPGANRGYLRACDLTTPGKTTEWVPSKKAGKKLRKLAKRLKKPEKG
jgi:hypothetical protein